MLLVWSGGTSSSKLWRKGEKKSWGVWWEGRCYCSQEALPGYLSVVTCGFIRHLDEFTKYLCVYFCACAVLEYMDPAGILRIRVQNAKPTFQNWFWTHCWWFYLHVLLCWQRFSSTYADARDPWGLFLFVPHCLTEHPSLHLVPLSSNCCYTGSLFIL